MTEPDPTQPTPAEGAVFDTVNDVEVEVAIAATMSRAEQPNPTGQPAEPMMLMPPAG